MTPKVTWLLPVRNGMPYLPETLASIAAQSYRDWEILAWDNGSTDGTVEELRQWIPGRLPGRVVADHPMRHLGPCRAELVRQSTTELCACIDADDVNLPQRLERQVAFLRRHPAIDLVGSQALLIDETGADRGHYAALPLKHDDIVHYMLHGCGIANPTVLFRRDAVLAAGNYQDVGPICVEDYDLWLRFVVRHRVANLDEPLVKYRLHDKSSTQSLRAGQRLFGAMLECYCQRAPILLGISATEARLLLTRQHPQAGWVLLRIAQYLTRTQGGRLPARLRSPSFRRARQALASPHDHFTRLLAEPAYRQETVRALPRQLPLTVGRCGKRFKRLLSRGVATIRTGRFAAGAPDE